MITSNEFFEIPGRWPLAFTIWRYNEAPKGNKNVIDPRDYTFLERKDLDIDWTEGITTIDQQLHRLVDKVKGVKINARIPSLKDWAGQSMYDFKRDRIASERKPGTIVGGLPLLDPRRANSKTYGVSDSQLIGLMDNLTPVRAKQSGERLSNVPDRLWFRLDTQFADANKARSQNAPPDQKGYCAYDLETAKKHFSWYSIMKAIQSNNPLWCNQLDLWPPNIPDKFAKKFFALSFALVLSEASCVVTKFEKDNPIAGAPEIFLDNPLSPNNSESFLSTTLAPAIEASGNVQAKSQLKLIRELYRVWSLNYCKGRTQENVGLEDEPYFKYFEYPDFVTPNSGIVQIKKFANVRGALDLINMLDDLSSNSKAIKEEIYRMLIEDFKYFE